MCQVCCPARQDELRGFTLQGEGPVQFVPHSEGKEGELQGTGRNKARCQADSSNGQT